MKKIGIAIFACIIIIFAIIYALFNVCEYLSNEKLANEQLEKTYAVISTNSKIIDNNITQISGENVNRINNQNNNEKITNNKILAREEVLCEDNVIGVLTIPCLNIIAPIQDGTSQEIMKTSIGHFIESDYWNGNVSFASHNSGTSAHYFENINSLKENDKIEYTTKIGTKTYKVTGIYKITSTDWSMINKVDCACNENTITLVTCINGLPNYRLCVRGTEI